VEGIARVIINIKGGPGSGNWGHRGRPGKRGGSSLRSVGLSPTSGKDWLQRYEKKTGKKHPTAEKKPTRRGGTPGMGYESADASRVLIHGPVPSSSWMFAKKSTILKIKANVVASLSEESGVADNIVSDMLAMWDYTSNDASAEALSMQEAASEEFDVPLSKWQKDAIQNINESDEVSRDVVFRDEVSRDDERAVLKAMYDNTQAELARQGYKPGARITLYRGMASPPDPTRKVGSVANYKGNAMESWSAGEQVAKDFAIRAGVADQQGVVLSMAVPIENIMGTAITGFGGIHTGEFVVLGNIASEVSIMFAT